MGCPLDWVDILVRGVVTLATTFAGAAFAFWFAARGRKTVRLEDEIAEGNLALFTLTTIWSRLRQYQREIIEPWRGKSDAWLNMPVTAPLDTEETTINTQKLVNILVSEGKAFQAITIEPSRYRLAAHFIEMRNSLSSDIYVRLRAAGIKIGQGVPNHTIEGALGDDIVHRLKQYTEAIISNIDEDVESSRVAFYALRDALKRTYPQAKFINTRWDADPGTMDATSSEDRA